MAGEVQPAHPRSAASQEPPEPNHHTLPPRSTAQNLSHTASGVATFCRDGSAEEGSVALRALQRSAPRLQGLRPRRKVFVVIIGQLDDKQIVLGQSAGRDFVALVAVVGSLSGLRSALASSSSGQVEADHSSS